MSDLYGPAWTHDGYSRLRIVVRVKKGVALLENNRHEVQLQELAKRIESILQSEYRGAEFTVRLKKKGRERRLKSP